VDAGLRAGLLLTLDVPASAGPHQVRAAVRDTASGRTGSAAAFVEVPDLEKERPALSGIVIGGVLPAGPGAIEAAEDPEATPAVRRFRSGSSVAYAFAVYNARVDSTGSARLKVQMNLFREGVRVQSLPDPPATSAALPDGVVSVGGALRLGREMEPGAYTLVVTVEDQLRRGKDRYGLQWADFEVVPAS
jgi:hypothetical protein